MNKLTIWFGVLFFIGSIIIVINKYEDLQVQRNGEIVKMRIEKMPANCLGGKSYYFAKLSFRDTIYDVRINGNFCDQHHVGELIDMKYLTGSSIVLFPNESVTTQIVSGIFISSFGLFIMITYWKKIYKKSR